VEVQTHAFLTSALDGVEVLNFTSRALYSRRNNPQYPLDRTMDGPQSGYGHGGEEKKIPAPVGNRTPVVQPVAYLYLNLHRFENLKSHFSTYIRDIHFKMLFSECGRSIFLLENR
jgi:hypothetical protein